jgi:diguanylate cyclase (GGDEF)-like protein
LPRWLRRWLDRDRCRSTACCLHHLPPRDYTLRLRGSNCDGAWTPAVLSIPIRILPAWHQRSEFRLAEVGLAIAGVAALVQVRAAYLRRHERELERQVADRTAELERRTVELRKSQQPLEHFAYSDALTGLPNRRMFTEDFRKLLALAHRRFEPFALLLIDLDPFKHINDTLGHDAGDALLIEAGVRLRAVVREIDSIARLGGDEFAILLAGEPEPGIDLVCQRIAESFRSAIAFNGASMTTSPSIGIARFPEHGGTCRFIR